MKEVRIKNIKELVINKEKIIIYQNDGGIVELTKEQVKNIGNEEHICYNIP